MICGEGLSYKMLFKDRTLNLAILISASWHLLCIVGFTPELTPRHIRQNHTNIAFLGAILERVSPASDKPFVLDNVSLLHKMDDSRVIESKDLSVVKLYDVLDFVNSQPKKEEFLPSFYTQVPLVPITQHKKEISRVKFSDFLVKGQAKDRVIIYKPGLDKPFILPSDFSSDYSVDVKFRISKYGFVKDAECVISSGSSEIDRLAIRYLRGWQFVPSSEDNQEGTTRVSFQ